MSTKFKHGLQIVVSVLLVGLNVALLNVLLSGSRVLRADLTDGKYFTLTDTTRDLLRDLEEGVEIRFYYSPLEKQHPLLRPIIEPLKDILREFDAEGGDKVRLQLVDLEAAGQEARDQAKNDFNVQYLPFEFQDATSSGFRNAFFSIVVIAGSDYEELDLREDFQALFRVRYQGNDPIIELGDVEYALTSTILKLTQGFDSAAGALAARDVNAKVTYFVTAKDTLPESTQGAPEAFEKVAKKIAAESGGRLQYEIKDPFEGIGELPEGQREAARQDKARSLFQQYGIELIPGGLVSKEAFYSWLVFDVAGRVAPVELVSPKEKLGESDIKSTIDGALKQLIPGFLPVVGIASPTPPFDPMMARMGQRPPPDEFQGVAGILAGSYETEPIDVTQSTVTIPRGVETLVLIRPGELSDAALYAIDQFVMAGGRLVVCIDHYSVDFSQAQTAGLVFKEQKTDSLRAMLAHWGVDVSTDALLDERNEFQEYIVQEGMALRTKRDYIPPFVRVDRAALNDTNLVTKSLSSLTLLGASPIAVGKTPDGVRGQVLIESSANATTTSSTTGLVSSIGPKWTAPSGAKAYSLAVAMEGTFPSYFVDKPIPGQDAPIEEPDTGEPGAAKTTKEQPKGGLLKKSPETKVIVIGDADFLSIPVFRMFLGDRNGDRLTSTSLRLVQNAIDWGGEKGGLLEIRSRPPQRRPLEALRGLDDEARLSKIRTTQWLAGSLTLGALAALAGGWLAYRSTRRPMTLLPRTHVDKETV